MEKKSKMTKIMAVIIAILTIVIVGLVVVLFGGGKDDKSETTTEKNTETETTAEADSSEKDSTETSESEDTTEEQISEKADCYVTITNSNSWEGNGKYYGQLDAKIINDSTTELKNWTIEIQTVDGVTVDSFWNGNCEIADKTLTITPVDYNNVIMASSTVSDIGVIVCANSAQDIKDMLENPVLYIDGEKYTTSSSQTSTNEDEASDDKKEESEDTNTTEATTEESETQKEPESGTPFDNHGKLSVSGTDLVDESGNKYQLKGISTHGLAWFPDYVNKDAFQTLRDDWGANAMRLAMYTDEYGGYCSGGDKEYLKGLVDTGVNAATELGMYVIIDWHILHDLTPQKYKEDAKAFFEEVSSKYKDYDNVIYEICNEPNGGTGWSDVKSYAEEIIPIIRNNDSDAIIIVGTPTWCQDVDVVAQDPLTGYDNIMYALHFYATTHTDGIRNKAVTALESGLPIIISEFSICDASGNGAIDYDQAEKWFELIGEYNLSYMAWNLSNKAETSSLISSSCTKTSGWTEGELSETGVWIRNKILGN